MRWPLHGSRSPEAAIAVIFCGAARSWGHHGGLRERSFQVGVRRGEASGTRHRTHRNLGSTGMKERERENGSEGERDKRLPAALYTKCSAPKPERVQREPWSILVVHIKYRSDSGGGTSTRRHVASVQHRRETRLRATRSVAKHCAGSQRQVRTTLLFEFRDSVLIRGPGDGSIP